MIGDIRSDYGCGGPCAERLDRCVTDKDEIRRATIEAVFGKAEDSRARRAFSKEER